MYARKVLPHKTEEKKKQEASYGERAGNQQPTTQQPRLHATGSGRRTGHGIHRYKATLALGRA